MRLTYIKSGFVGYPAWSLTKVRLLHRCDGTNDGIYIVPALGGRTKTDRHQLPIRPPSRVAWLTDSRMLMIDRCPASGLHGLAIFSMDTGEKRCIADFGPSEWDRRFMYSLSPNQTTIAFFPAWDSPICKLYTAPISGGSPHLIVEDKSGGCGDIMWTRTAPESCSAPIEQVLFVVARSGQWR